MPSFSSRRRPSPDYYQEPLTPEAGIVRAAYASIKTSMPPTPGHHGRVILLCLSLAMGTHGLLGWLLMHSPADIKTTPPPPPVVMQLVAPPAPPMSTSAPADPKAVASPPEIQKAALPPAPPSKASITRPKTTPTQAPKKIVTRGKTPSPSLPAEQPGKASAEAPRQTVPSSAPAPEQPLVGPYGRAGYLNNPPPTYPPIAVRLRQQGIVVLRVHVRADGRPEQVQVFTSSGFDTLDQAAIKAVNQWTFMPAKRGEVATDGWVNVPLAFKLSN